MYIQKDGASSGGGERMRDHASVALWDVPPAVDRAVRWDGYVDWTKAGDKGVGEERRWRESMFAKLPDTFLGPISARFRDRYESGGLRAANAELLDLVERAGGDAHRLAASDGEVCEWAARRADECRRTAARSDDPDIAYLFIAAAARRYGVEPPDVEQYGVTGALARLACPMWWRRQARKVHGRNVEAAAIGLGLVGSGAGLYASDEAVKRRGQQRRRNRAMLESTVAVNEEGQEYTLAQLSDLSVSNAPIRRGELMLRLRGMEDVADRLGHAGEFYNMTVPSRMHKVSDKYDGTTPRAAQQWLCKVWGKIRAALNRRGVFWYGVRVAEPHKDGTPHWHAVLFMAERCRRLARVIVTGYMRGIIRPHFRYGPKMGRYVVPGTGVCWLDADGGEKGAARHRCKIKRVDKSKGSATSYLAKYIAKNIDGYCLDTVDEDLTGERDPRECARRVDAWAACWGIRQFQQMGGAPVGVWRELRRLAKGQEGFLEDIRAVVDKPADFGAYIDKMGGPTASRKERPVQLAMEWVDKEGRYGEPLGDRVFGVECEGRTAVTRIHEWRVERGQVKGRVFGEEKGQDGRGVAASRARGISQPTRGHNEVQGWGLYVDGAHRGSMDCEQGISSGALRRGLSVTPAGLLICAGTAPWSPVNNCTGGDDENKGNGFKNGGGERKAFAVATEGGGGGSVDRRGGGNFGRYGGRGGDAAGEGPPPGRGAEWRMTP